MTRSEDVNRARGINLNDNEGMQNAFAELMGDYLELLEENKNLKKQLGYAIQRD